MFIKTDPIGETYLIVIGSPPDHEELIVDVSIYEGENTIDRTTFLDTTHFATLTREEGKDKIKIELFATKKEVGFDKLIEKLLEAKEAISR